jgi:hypothetical protein
MSLLLENNPSEHIREMLDVRSGAPTRQLGNQYTTKRRQTIMNCVLHGLGVVREIENAHPELGC